MRTIYVLKLENKRNIEKMIKYHVNFIKIKYVNDTCFLYVDENNYQKLTKYFEIYQISLVKIKGLLGYRLFIKKYYLFLISMIMGIGFVFLLSNMIFDIKIMTNNKEIIDIINKEFSEAKLLKYHFVKSFEEKEKIKERILNNYKNKIEWLEIDRKGSRYYVNVLERIINNEEKDTKYQNIISKRNAIILEIKASNGQIIKKVNDYVNKGDVIISGYITKNDDVKDIVRAEGQVFGETWYTVKVELPRTYEKLTYTGNSYKRWTINLFNKKWFLFGKKNYKLENIEDKVIINNKILPFSLVRTTVYEMKKDNYIYTYSDAMEEGINFAREKLLNYIPEDSEILEQKKLKLYEENSKIIVEVFFKVYEDITDYSEIEGE